MRRKDREITGIADIESIIVRADVCRIAMADKDIPYIVTMNFGYSGGSERKLWFHCAREGRKLEMIRKNNYVCFEMDTDHNLESGAEACDFSMKYSSVTGWGKIFIIEDPEEKKEGLNSIMNHYSNGNNFTYNPGLIDKTAVLRLDIMSMTGKKC